MDEGSFKTMLDHVKTVDESVCLVPDRPISTLDLTAGVEKTPDTPERYEEGRDS